MTLDAQIQCLGTRWVFVRRKMIKTFTVSNLRSLNSMAKCKSLSKCHAAAADRVSPAVPVPAPAPARLAH